MSSALQLKIYLQDIKPLIWRRVIVNSDLTLAQLNTVIQSVMPWAGGHLHQFTKKDERYLSPYPEADELSLPLIDNYNKTIVSDLLKKEGDHLKYEYDLGDSWMHSITVEKVVPALEEQIATYIKGKNMAPPEDCGGVTGYARLKEIMSNPKHPEYKEMAEWLIMEEDEIFDPTYIGYSEEEIDDILCDALEFNEDDFWDEEDEF